MSVLESDTDQNQFRPMFHLTASLALTFSITLIYKGYGGQCGMLAIVFLGGCGLAKLIAERGLPFLHKGDETISLELVGVDTASQIQVLSDANGEDIAASIAAECKLPEEANITIIFAGKLVDPDLTLVEQGICTGSQIVVLVHEDGVKRHLEEEPKPKGNEEEKKQQIEEEADNEPTPNLIFPPDDSDDSEDCVGEIETPSQKPKPPPQCAQELLTVDTPDMISLECGPEPRFSMCKDTVDKPIHGLTRASLLSYLQHKAEDGCFEIHCPESECDCRWDYPFIVRVLDGFEDFTPETRKNLEKKLSANLISKKMNAKRCGNCSLALRRSILNKNFDTTCVGCEQNFCWACQHPWKENAAACVNMKCPSWVREVTCAVLKNCPTKRIDHMDLVPVLRACPSCGQLITHISDCKHMDCPICHKSFCFICVLPADDAGNYQCGYDAETCRLAVRQSKEDLVLTGLRSYSSILGPIDCVSTVSSNHGEAVQEIPDEMTSTEFYEKFAGDLLRNLEAAGWEEVEDEDY